MNITNKTKGAFIDGSSDNDSIKNTAIIATIFSYSGNDTIDNQVLEMLGSPRFCIDAGKGNDEIIHVGGGSKVSEEYIDYYPRSSIFGGEGDDGIFVKGIKDYLTFYANRYFVNGDAGNDYISLGSYTEYNTISGGDGNDTIYSYSQHSNIDGGNGADSISNTGSYVKIEGGADNDFIEIKGSDSRRSTILGGTGNDSIKLSNSKHLNLIQYAEGDGNDVIEGISSLDTLNITSGTITKAGRSGNDAVIYVGNDHITLKDAAERTLNLKVGYSVFSTILSEEISIGGGDDTDRGGDDTNQGGDDEEETVVFNNVNPASATAATITEYYEEEEFDAADYAKLKTIDASEASSGLTIIGNKIANKIIGSEGNDCITGGKGTDTFTGGAGEDTFVYISGDGSKVITDYTEGEDKIEIQGADVETVIKSASIKSGDVIFKVGSGKITVKDGENQKITFNDEGGNEFNYKYCGSPLGDDPSGENEPSNNIVENLWFFEDNNYITDSAQLSDITEKKFAVTQVQTPNYSALEQINQTFLTYGKEK